ncbi:flagellar biosynthesis protein FlhB [Beijerinckia indica]|uniref:Flagellar biosynthetic protein FlhB n=1 Tax=Beijerinckia indica subsp. indica (strain ATCC 9039 / DSM 1715 / NCIMB 8712) TaxID=395963 RepID=B2IK02_BEII9|nr:flagellar biosynthesis protein FlhB [Beijerinckia indica]ACB96377.1 flagellar biosynthetic protein FlhB [Beijerinckia indica subsp. indica ATCC 9039]
MAEKPDQDSQTEEPTAKKMDDAIEQGNLPISREMIIFASMLSLLIVNAFILRNSLADIVTLLKYVFNNSDQIPLRNQLDAVNLFQLILTETGPRLVPIILPFMIAGIAANIGQSKLRLILERIQPDFGHLSLISGWKKLFGQKNLAEFLKNVIKLSAVALLLFMVLKGNQDKLINAMFLDPSAIPELILSLSMRLLSVICIVTIVLATADLLWVKNQWRRDLRMSKQEIKDELKQMEGDPLIKARLRSVALDRIRKSMIADVPKATVVIANPTHFAVALRYVREEGGTPVVVAKGTDLIALKIREIAEAHNIPIVEDRPLARSLHASVEVNQAIPAEFYRAIAEIIHYLNTKKSPQLSIH